MNHRISTPRAAIVPWSLFSFSLLKWNEFLFLPHFPHSFVVQRKTHCDSISVVHTFSFYKSGYCIGRKSLILVSIPNMFLERSGVSKSLISLDSSEVPFPQPFQNIMVVVLEMMMMRMIVMQFYWSEKKTYGLVFLDLKIELRLWDMVDGCLRGI